MADETLIQSQQVTLTGPVEQIPELLKELELRAWYRKCTVTLKPTSVPDATVGVTRDSQQNPRQRINFLCALPSGHAGRCSSSEPERLGPDYKIEGKEW